MEKFLNYLNQYDEEILLVFWGDHLPNIYSEEVVKLNSILTLRETPLFFYSNQKDLSGDGETISPTYYMNHILDIMDMKVTSFGALKMELEEVLLGNYGGLYLEVGNGSPVATREDLSEETTQILYGFYLFQYDIVSGEQYVEDVGFMSR